MRRGADIRPMYRGGGDGCKSPTTQAVASVRKSNLEAGVRLASRGLFVTLMEDRKDNGVVNLTSNGMVGTCRLLHPEKVVFHDVFHDGPRVALSIYFG